MWTEHAMIYISSNVDNSDELSKRISVFHSLHILSPSCDRLGISSSGRPTTNKSLKIPNLINQQLAR